MHQLRRLVMVGLVAVVCLGLAACDGSQGRKAPSISPADMALIERQAEGFLSARNRLPELASLVNERNWVFTANLIHGPMQEVGREMSYINQRLLPADRPEDGDKLRKAYIKVASGFGLYAQVFPAQVQENLKQV
jgi:photosystem II protein PsbQ